MGYTEQEKVEEFKNLSALIWKAIVIPRKIVIKLAKTFCAVSEIELRTPHSRIRLPNIKKPISETDSGATTPAIAVIMMGNRILVSLETSLA